MPRPQLKPRTANKTEQGLLDKIRTAEAALAAVRKDEQHHLATRQKALRVLLDRGWTPGDIQRGSDCSAQRVRDLFRAGG